MADRTVSENPVRSDLPENLSQALSQSHLRGLEALRAAAVFLVILYHHNYPIPGGLGVLAFFVLSGFLITWLLLKERERYGGVSLKLFYFRRALRIFPAFYFYWIFVLGMLLLTGRKIDWPQAWSAFFYVSNYYQAINGHASSVLSHAWSLGVEEQFYLLWPVAFIWLGRRTGERLWIWVAAAIGAIWIWRAVLVNVIGMREVWLYEAFDARADHLLLGCLLALVLRQRLAAGFWRLLCAQPWMPLLTLALLAGESAIELTIGLPRNFEFIVQPLLVAVLIVQTMAFASSPGWQWLSHPWLVYLGKISYSLYLWQQAAPSLVKPLARHFPALPEIVFTLPAILLAASASYAFVETPFLRWKERAGARQPQPLKTSAPPETPLASDSNGSNPALRSPPAGATGAVPEQSA